MTEALDAMVKAMVAEFERQKPQGVLTAGYPDEDLTCVELADVFDLEKVARAGLTAIREPTADVADAGGEIELPDGYSYLGEFKAKLVWCAMIEKILEEPR